MYSLYIDVNNRPPTAAHYFPSSQNPHAHLLTLTLSSWQRLYPTSKFAFKPRMAQIPWQVSARKMAGANLNLQ